jgi:phosphinothricin acetyltransferase
MPLDIRQAVISDAAAITSIYNEGIAERGATFETDPRRVTDIEARFADEARFPILVAEADGRVISWAGLSSYRPRRCYAGIAEFSIYLDRSARGRGAGRRLLDALIDAARERGYWKLVSRVFPFNTASRALCRACGFREVGVYEKHACLDGRWTDVVIVERLIPENLTVSASRNDPPPRGPQQRASARQAERPASFGDNERTSARQAELPIDRSTDRPNRRD